MESLEVLEAKAVANRYSDGCIQGSVSVEGNEDRSQLLLDDFESFFYDIEDRLTISRMVSDSVIKGMVNATAQDAAEKIAEKESEVAQLKEQLCFYSGGPDLNVQQLGSLMNCQPNIAVSKLPSNIHAEHATLMKSLGCLRLAAVEQLKKLKNDIDNIRSCSPVRRVSSSSEMVGLGGILQGKVSEKWEDVDKSIDNLNVLLDTVYKHVDDIGYLSKLSLHEWQQDRDFQGEIEAIVVQTSMQGLCEEFEEKMWGKNSHFCGIESVNWADRMNELSSVRQELDAVLKSLPVPEYGQLASHVSYESGEEVNNTIKSDHLQQKNSSHQSKIIVPENLDAAQLKHMKHDELVSFFKAEMTNMKRCHESVVQEMTEQCFSLKRELFKERGPSLPLKKEKEFEALKKRVTDVTVKLDDILTEHEKFPKSGKCSESLKSLKDGLEALLSENHHLRDVLADKQKDVKCLSSQVSDASEKMLEYSLSEVKLLKTIHNLKCTLEDKQMEALISEEVYKCILKEVTDQFRFGAEELVMESTLIHDVYGIILKDATFQDSEASSRYHVEDSELEVMIMQGLCEVFFGEVVKEAGEKINNLEMMYITENKLRSSLEAKASEQERSLQFEVEESKRIKQEALLLAAKLVEDENLALKLASEVRKEKERFELASPELDNLREIVQQQQMSNAKNKIEYEEVKNKLAEALEQIDKNKAELCQSNLELTQAKKDLMASDEKRKILHCSLLEKEKSLSVLEAREKEHRKQFESILRVMQELLGSATDFESRLSELMEMNNSRLENSSDQLSLLIKKANRLRRTGLLFKQRLERRCDDLQKAEREVDLLGDEVDALSSLLEKIYIALDHYSPVLQHYPGIIEILKLVKRELSKDATKVA
ncbi:hypothetical protein RJ641_001680 [Dillenia turbinata]|uniref:WPP domain-associated protein n=1 Tax=Dillenia turbinata TaxID=194707 RepID=A0AAN8ZBH0_9MAGN